MTERGRDGSLLQWGLRRCDNNECASTFWNRDVNAALNISLRFQREQLGLGVPSQFERRTAEEREDGLSEQKTPPTARKRVRAPLSIAEPAITLAL